MHYSISVQFQCQKNNKWHFYAIYILKNRLTHVFHLFTEIISQASLIKYFNKSYNHF